MYSIYNSYIHMYERDTVDNEIRGMDTMTMAISVYDNLHIYDYVLVK